MRVACFLVHAEKPPSGGFFVGIFESGISVIVKGFELKTLAAYADP